jgi:hypothetical protein
VAQRQIAQINGDVRSKVSSGTSTMRVSSISEIPWQFAIVVRHPYFDIVFVDCVPHIVRARDVGRHGESLTFGEAGEGFVEAGLVDID